MHLANLRLIIDASSERSAHRVLDRVLNIVDATTTKLERYYKGGFEAVLELPIAEADWPNQVVALLRAAQSLGCGWTLLGDIDSEVEMTGSQFRDSGLEFASIGLRRSRSSIGPLDGA